MATIMLPSKLAAKVPKKNLLFLLRLTMNTNLSQVPIFFKRLRKVEEKKFYLLAQNNYSTKLCDKFPRKSRVKQIEPTKASKIMQ